MGSERPENLSLDEEARQAWAASVRDVTVEGTGLSRISPRAWKPGQVRARSRARWAECAAPECAASGPTLAARPPGGVGGHCGHHREPEDPHECRRRGESLCARRRSSRSPLAMGERPAALSPARALSDESVGFSAQATASRLRISGLSTPGRIPSEDVRAGQSAALSADDWWAQRTRGHRTHALLRTLSRRSAQLRAGRAGEDGNWSPDPRKPLRRKCVTDALVTQPARPHSALLTSPHTSRSTWSGTRGSHSALAMAAAPRGL